MTIINHHRHDVMNPVWPVNHRFQLQQLVAFYSITKEQHLIIFIIIIMTIIIITEI